MGEGRTFLASVVAGSAAAGPVLALINAIEDEQLALDKLWHLAKESFAASFFAFPVVAFAGIFVGLPFSLVLRRLGATSLFVWLLTGFLVGGAVGATVLPALFCDGISSFLLGAAPGLAAASIWWFLAERGHSREMQENA